MAADLYVFLNDRLHISNPNVSLSASSVAAGGYAVDNARRADLMTAWKGNDSTTGDEWLQVDGGATGWIGSSGQTAFAVIAYDNRGADQDTINLNTDASDDPAMPSQSTRATWTVSGFKSEITMEWKSWVITTPAKRYYRLLQPGGARSETTGSITTKILNWAMFNADGVMRLSVDFTGDAEAAYGIRSEFRSGEARTAGGLRLFNKYAQPGQRFTVTFEPATRALWQRFRDAFKLYGGGVRAFYVLKDGLDNQALANFFLCRLTDLQYRASVQYRDSYMVEMEWETEPWL